MKYRMLTSRSGPTINDVQGDIVEISDDEAGRMMAADPPQCVKATEAEIKADDEAKAAFAKAEKAAKAKAKAKAAAIKKAEKAALVAKAKAERPEKAIK